MFFLVVQAEHNKVLKDLLHQSLQRKYPPRLGTYILCGMDW